MLCVGWQLFADVSAQPSRPMFQRVKQSKKKKLEVSAIQRELPQALRSGTLFNGKDGCAMAQAVSRRPFTAKAQVQCRVSQSGIRSGQSGTGKGLTPSTSVFHCQISLQRCSITRKKTNHLHHRVARKRQGCGASVASAAGPFTTKAQACHDFDFSLNVTMGLYRTHAH
jgi:hypothetical protein